MQQSLPLFFTRFVAATDSYVLPERFTNPFALKSIPHPLAIAASLQLQEYLKHQQDWKHSFGINNSNETSNEHGIGKMFGVLVVQTVSNEIGYLSAFSGKLAGGNHHANFVPPVFDSLSEDSFLNEGMNTLAVINQQIQTLKELNDEAHNEQIMLLKQTRKNHSSALQEKLFDSYHFSNQYGKEKSLRSIFKDTHRPPSGAGECAAPKLLQYAFQHGLKPIAMAEFWWGSSHVSHLRQHGHFYPSCTEKCAPILAHMLEGMNIEKV